MKGKRRFKSDLVPAQILVARYFAAERDAIAALDSRTRRASSSNSTRCERSNGGEEGLLAEVIEGEGDKQKITAKSREGAPAERSGRTRTTRTSATRSRRTRDLLEQQTDAKAKRKAAQEDLEARSTPSIPSSPRPRSRRSWWTTSGWPRSSAAVQGELDRVSQTLTGRIRQLAERYAMPLPKLTDEVDDARRPRRGASQADGSVMEVKPGYKQTEVGVIPEDWEVEAVVELCVFMNGSTTWRQFPTRTRRLVLSTS